MSNSSCASPTDVARFNSWNFLFSQFVGLAAIIITYVSTVFATKLVMRKSIFELSTKILILQILFYANLFQTIYCIEAIALLYKSFFLVDRPCELLQSEAHCAAHFEMFLIGTSGMIYGQTGLMVERACATFFTNYPKTMRLTVSWAIFGIVTLLSAISGHLIVWDDPLEGYSFGCFVIPKKSVPRASRFYVLCTILALFNLTVSLLIMNYNKRFEYATRFKVCARFQKRQAIESTGTICFLALFLFVFILIYSIGICILLNIRSFIPANIFNFFITWCYTIPFVAVMLPLVLIYRIRSTRANRVQTICDITQVKQTQEDHMQQMQNMWR